MRYSLGHESVEFYGARHGSKPPDVRDRHVIMVDFSYPYDEMLKVTNVCKSLTVLDHYKITIDAT